MSRNAFAELVRDELAAEDQREIHRDELAQMERIAMADALRLHREELKNANIEAESAALMAEWVDIAKADEYVKNYEMLLEERKFIVSDVALVLALVTRGDLNAHNAAAYLGNQVINLVKAQALKVAKHHVEGAE